MANKTIKDLEGDIEKNKLTIANNEGIMTTTDKNITENISKISVIRNEIQGEENNLKTAKHAMQCASSDNQV